MSFADLGLSDELLRAVTESGYTEPTPIQQQTIPSVLMMRDIVGIAQTGTGKTAAFVLPMIDILGNGRTRARMPRSLILEPTRELAAQVAENFVKYGKYHKLSMALLIGGVQMGDQVKALEKGVDVLIATPGRLMDLFGRGKIMLNDCTLLVIDEADRMLDMGFIPDIEEICTKLPASRQTLLFSATMPPPIKKLSDRFLSNPKSVEVARPATANVNITQWLVKVDERKKRDRLVGLIEAERNISAIVFCNRKTTVRELATSLKRARINAGEIHGDMDQASRIAELDRFKRGDLSVLVASDVAARGLDVKGISHVFNYDTPWHPDDYVHRIGRTGRAGATGIAYTFVTPKDEEAIANIQQLTGQKIAWASDGGNAQAARAAAEEPSQRDAGELAARPARNARTRKAPVAAVEREAESAPKARSTRQRSSEPEAAPAYEAAPEPARETAQEPARSGRKQPPAVVAVDVREDSGDGWNGPMPDFLGFSFGS